MTRSDLVYWLTTGLVVVAFLAVVGYCGYVYATCDGTVVKGFFDQPVCLEKR